MGTVFRFEYFALPKCVAKNLLADKETLNKPLASAKTLKLHPEAHPGYQLIYKMWYPPTVVLVTSLWFRWQDLLKIGPDGILKVDNK